MYREPRVVFVKQSPETATQPTCSSLGASELRTAAAAGGLLALTGPVVPAAAESGMNHTTHIVGIGSKYIDREVGRKRHRDSGCFRNFRAGIAVRFQLEGPRQKSVMNLVIGDRAIACRVASI